MNVGVSGCAGVGGGSDALQGKKFGQIFRMTHDAYTRRASSGAMLVKISITMFIVG